MSERALLVYISIEGSDILVGRLWCRSGQGRPSTATFAYSDSWLDHPKAFELSPALPLSKAPHHTSRAMPVVFSDCSPDSWGQRLMRRGERMRAENDARASRSLAPVDFLIGVDDSSRMGALRFRDTTDGNFLTCGGQPVPPLIELPALLNASMKIDQGRERNKDVALVLTPGASLGGARPKATVRDKDGSLLVAKFPKTDDQWPIIKWESIELELAEKAGIIVPNSRLESCAGKPVLLLSRFDRTPANGRIPFMSAMTSLDEDDHATRSYLDLVEVIRRYGSEPSKDLRQLWRRVLFNTLSSNLDDHLRNHAFLWDGRGWVLSPAFDMNPVPSRETDFHKLTINESDATPSFELVVSVASKFGLKKAEAISIASDVASALSDWRSVAKKHKLRPSEIDQMASAFDHSDLRRASGTSPGTPQKTKSTIAKAPDASQKKKVDKKSGRPASKKGTAVAEGGKTK